MFRRIRLVLLLLLCLSLAPSARGWFTSESGVDEMATMVPTDTVLFLGLDLGPHVAILAEHLETLVRTLGGSRGVAQFEKNAGASISEIASWFGPRAFFAMTSLPDKGEPKLVFGIEMQEPDRGVELFRLMSGVPSKLREVKLGGTSFQFSDRGPGGYGVHKNFLVVTNSQESLHKALEEGTTLREAADYRRLKRELKPGSGLYAFARSPEQLQAQDPYQILSAVVAMASSLELDGDLMGQLFVELDTDTPLAQALLTAPGELTAKSARYVPDEWGFLTVFDLPWCYQTLQALKRERPELSEYLQQALDELEKHIGVSLEEMVEVSSGEVGISSNGLKLLPNLMRREGEHPPYRLTVTLGLRDTRRAERLLQRAWKKLELEVDSSQADLVELERAELCYTILEEQKLLIMSYGPAARPTLRYCLGLSKAQSLASRPRLQRAFPMAAAVAGGYVDARPFSDALRGHPSLGLAEMLFLQIPNMDGTVTLGVESTGLQASASGVAPAAAALGAGAALYLLGI